MVSQSEVLPIAATAGQMLLRYGADISRVEDTVRRIAQAYGVMEVETYVTPTGLFLTLGADMHVTTVKRVRQRTMELDKVSAINALSRQLAVEPLDPAAALERLRAIERQPPPFPAWTRVPVDALAAAAATMLVGGQPRDFFPALLANLVVQGVKRVAAWLQLPETLADYLAGGTAVGAALGLHAWFGSEIGPVVAGGIMILLPGTAFTATVRDAMAGDLVSSGARGLEAFTKAVALASGVATALYVTGGKSLG